MASLGYEMIVLLRVPFKAHRTHALTRLVYTHGYVSISTDRFVNPVGFVNSRV